MYRQFVDVVGDKSISSYLKSDGVAFKAALVRSPSLSGRFAGMNFQEAGELADKVGFKKRVTITTINSKLVNVSAVFRWARMQHDEEIKNPVENLKIKDTQKRGAKRQPLTVDELSKLFSAPVYTGCKNETSWSSPGPNIYRDNGKYWLPLLGLFTGARKGELVQLTRSDVREVDGIHFIDINQDEANKSVKNEESLRRIPLHPDLIDMGFLDFVSSEKTGRLFAEFKRATSGSISDTFSKHFARFRKSVGVDGSFHALRHNFKDAARDAEIMEDVVFALQGHTQRGMSAIYGSGFGLEVLDRAMKKIKYKGLDLSHLRCK